VAPSPQAKGKIERRFKTFQNRMLALLAYAKVKSYDHANEILQMEINRQNHAVYSPTGKVPNDVFESARSLPRVALRPPPLPTLLDLHLSLRSSRKVNNDNTIEFDGRSFQIAPTLKKHVPILFHPEAQLWILETKPTHIWPAILGRFSL
jgi:hypothetical protein